MENVKQESTCKRRGLFVGLAAVDISYLVESIPRADEKVSVGGQQVSAGGPATNAAVTFAFLGGSGALVTGVGQHPLSTVIKADLSEFSVSLHDAAADLREAPPVSSILVVRDTGERTVISANANAFPPVTLDLDPDWFSGVAVVLVDGHYMPMCIAAAQYARALGIPVVLDSGSWKEGMPELLRHVDIAICSDDFRAPDSCSRTHVLEYLAGQGIRRVAITRGAAPVLYLDNGERGEIRVEQTRAVDMLGAGDIFHGAFCYWFTAQHSFREALAFAARVATFSCRYRGTRGWMREFEKAW
jgi:sugar/nucleoside kinase (ribokinase family)